MSEAYVVGLIAGTIVGYLLKTLVIVSGKRKMRDQLSRWSWPKDGK